MTMINACLFLLIHDGIIPQALLDMYQAKWFLMIYAIAERDV